MRIPGIDKRGGALRVPVDPRESLISNISKCIPVPAPVGGWNARDSLAAMPSTDAVSLINWIPQTTFLELRSGETSWATGMAATGKSLLPWNGPSGTGKLFAGTSSGIYNVTNTGAVGAVARAATNGKFQHVNFAVASGAQLLIIVNGTDEMLYYDGTNWTPINAGSVPAVTGVLTSNLIHVNIFKQRLFFIEKNKLSFWFLPVASIGGAATEFPLNQIFPKGGFCMAMATWSIDGGNGIDDFAVFITSEGEVAIFKGSNPADPAVWSLVGVWFLGKPIGRRCFKKYGGDLLLILQQGVFPLSNALLSTSVDKRKALTNKIEKAFNSVTQLYGSVFGWEVQPFPQQNLLLINVPHVEGGTHDQYVMNTLNKSWTQFNGWNAEALCEFGGNLFFTSGTGVFRALNGLSDLGSNIVADVKSAFNYFGSRGTQKGFKLVRPTLITTGPVTYTAGLNLDFEDIPPTNVVSSNNTAGSLWDTGLWDTATWGFGPAVQRNWSTLPAKTGYCAAMLLRVATKSVTVQWPSSDFVFEDGGTL